jgi:hypothetical protein
VALSKAWSIDFSTAPKAQYALRWFATLFARLTAARLEIPKLGQFCPDPGHWLNCQRLSSATLKGLSRFRETKPHFALFQAIFGHWQSFCSSQVCGTSEPETYA